MAAKIEVETTGGGEYRVRVSGGGTETSHKVTVKPEDYLRLTGGKVDASELVKRSFEFLLAHEPKESILGKFDLMVISRYFPEYEQEMKSKLQRV